MRTEQLRALLRDVVEAAISDMASVDDLRASGERDGQYGLDLIVDGPLVERLLDAGLGVLSEEAGTLESDRSLLAVVDPIDGSTNASRGLPWFNTSICVFDDEGPLVGYVENHVTRDRFEAIRGEGAWRNGEVMTPPGGSVAGGVVAVNGVPPLGGPWAQFRALGASALDISHVAAGVLDAYIDFDSEAHGLWDYAAAMLVCQEVGVAIVDAFDRPLAHRSHGDRRTPVVAHNVQDLEVLQSLRRAAGPSPTYVGDGTDVS